MHACDACMQSVRADPSTRCSISTAHAAADRAASLSVVGFVRVTGAFTAAFTVAFTAASPASESFESPSDELASKRTESDGGGEGSKVQWQN
eukprot:6178393-Pleurochrysis_carterae.AAC.2